VRFLIDMPLSPALAAWLVERGHDAVHAANLGLARETDAAVMARAKQERRTVITADLDYPRLLTLARATEPSVILFREGDWSDAAVITRMGEVLAAMTEADVASSILVVDHFRVRRRRLPIGDDQR
jgi:predicted nuclease of predicted toxin-antitoxin system